MKIFNIGLPKAGTCSLASALKKLGYTGWHHHIKDRCIGDYVSHQGFNGIPRFDFLSDFGWKVNSCKLIPFIEKQYPDSKFILTTRDKESRLNSYIKHMSRRDIETMKRTFKTFNSDEFDVWDKETFIKNHYETINFYSEYFKNKDNLLIIPIEAENKWELLCNFLGKPIPNIPYPRENAAPKGKN